MELPIGVNSVVMVHVTEIRGKFPLTCDAAHAGTRRLCICNLGEFFMRLYCFFLAGWAKGTPILDGYTR